MSNRSKQLFVQREKLVETGFIEFQKGKKEAQIVIISGNGHIMLPKTLLKALPFPYLFPLLKTLPIIRPRGRPRRIPLTPQGKRDSEMIFKKLFESWLSYKAEKRQAYKPTGLKSLITEIRNNAQKYGEAAVANLIRECMASNWTGIIFSRLKSGGTTQTTSEPPPRQYDAATGTWR